MGCVSSYVVAVLTTVDGRWQVGLASGLVTHADMPFHDLALLRVWDSIPAQLIAWAVGPQGSCLPLGGWDLVSMWLPQRIGAVPVVGRVSPGAFRGEFQNNACQS